jgi:hypothetical protein
MWIPGRIGSQQLQAFHGPQCLAELWIMAGTRHLGSYASEPAAYAARVTGFFVGIC